MGGVHAGKSRIHKAHKVGAHLVLGFLQTSIHGSRGLNLTGMDPLGFILK